MSLTIEDIFKESTLKLNQIIAFLDCNLGTKSLNDDEIAEVLPTLTKNKPSHYILDEGKVDPSGRLNQKNEKNKKQNSNKNDNGNNCKKADKTEDKKSEPENANTSANTKEKNHKKNKGNKKEEHVEKEDNKDNEKDEDKDEDHKEAEENKNKDKKKKQKKGASPEELFAQCDLRVGYVEECKIMEGFNDIYSLKIDLGEDENRIIGTGLRNHVPIDDIQGKKVIVFSNLKPKKFGTNFESNGMIMCASSVTKEGIKDKIELLRPNDDAEPGDKVYLEGTELDSKKEPQLSGGKFTKVIKDFNTDEDCNCMFNGVKLVTKDGVVTVKSLKNSHIS